MLSSDQSKKLDRVVVLVGVMRSIANTSSFFSFSNQQELVNCQMLIFLTPLSSSCPVSPLISSLATVPGLRFTSDTATLSPVLKVQIHSLCGLHSSQGIPGILIVGGQSTSDTAELFMPTIGLHCSLPDLPADHPKAEWSSRGLR